jgi:DNA-binding PadR family transcriptional regulator
MFGMRHGMRHGHEGRWAAGRHWRRHGGGFGWGGRHGMGDGDGDMVRAGRMLAQGDLRLIALALIAEQPRHGYEIIKVLEDKTEGWYSPSPGMVYPTLTYLEEAGYVSAQSEGSKRLYTITEEGRGYLAENKAFVDAVLERLAAIGTRVAHARRRQEEREDERSGPSVPPLVRAALVNLREVAAKRLETDADAEPKVVDVLARAAAEIKRN